MNARSTVPVSREREHGTEIDLMPSQTTTGTTPQDQGDGDADADADYWPPTRLTLFVSESSLLPAVELHLSQRLP